MQTVDRQSFGYSQLPCLEGVSVYLLGQSFFVFTKQSDILLQVSLANADGGQSFGYSQLPCLEGVSMYLLGQSFFVFTKQSH